MKAMSSGFLFHRKMKTVTESDDGGGTPDEKVKKGIKLFSCEVLNVCFLTANQIKLIATGSFDLAWES